MGAMTALEAILSAPKSDTAIAPENKIFLMFGLKF